MMAQLFETKEKTLNTFAAKPCHPNLVFEHCSALRVVLTRCLNKFCLSAVCTTVQTNDTNSARYFNLTHLGY